MERGCHTHTKILSDLFDTDGNIIEPFGGERKDIARARALIRAVVAFISVAFPLI